MSKRRSNLEITDIEVGDMVLTTAPLRFFTYGKVIVGEGKFIKIKKISSGYGALQGYKYYIITISCDGVLPPYDKVAWDQLKHKIITKNKEWDGITPEHRDIRTAKAVPRKY